MANSVVNYAELKWLWFRQYLWNCYINQNSGQLRKREFSLDVSFVLTFYIELMHINLSNFTVQCKTYCIKCAKDKYV
jgi:hypothetical protein